MVATLSKNKKVPRPFFPIVMMPMAISSPKKLSKILKNISSIPRQVSVSKTNFRILQIARPSANDGFILISEMSIPMIELYFRQAWKSARLAITMTSHGISTPI